MVTTMTACIYCVSLSTGCKCTSEDLLHRQKRITYPGFPITFQPLAPSLFSFLQRTPKDRESSHWTKGRTLFLCSETRPLSVISLTGSLRQTAIDRFTQASSRKLLRNTVTRTIIFALFSVVGKTPQDPFIARPNAVSDAIYYGFLYY